MLKDKEIHIWPDNDKPGKDAATGIAGIIKDLAKSVNIIDLNKIILPEKWDLADKLPEHLSQHQITNLLFEKTNLDRGRIANEYGKARVSELTKELEKSHITNFNDYLQEKQKIYTLTEIETGLVKTYIEEHKNLNSSSEISIQTQAAIKHPQLHLQILPKILPTINLQSELKEFENYQKQNHIYKELEVQNEH